MMLLKMMDRIRAGTCYGVFDDDDDDVDADDGNDLEDADLHTCSSCH